jgi:tetratricopeptide (TPR) repeat protein
MEKKLKQWSQAEQYFLTAIEKTNCPETKGRIFFDLCQMFYRKDPSKAEKYLVQASKANPHDAITHAKLAKWYGFQNRWEESEKCFKDALELKPSDQITKKWYEDMQRAKERDQTRKKNSKRD